MKLGASLALHSGPSPATVEEAIVLLGSERLRILVNAWPLQAGRGEPSAKHEPSSNEREQEASRRSRTAKQIASRRRGFRDLLGDETIANAAGSAGPISSVLSGFQYGSVRSPEKLPLEHIEGQIQVLAEMFVRDFAALALRVEPAVAEPRVHVLYAVAPSSSSSRRPRE